MRYIRVDVGRTINIGNYESLRASVSLEAEVEPSESVTEARKALNIQAMKELDAVAKNMVKAYMT